MQNASSHTPSFSPAQWVLACPSPSDSGNEEFLAMLDAYRHNGGLARAQEVAAMFKSRSESDIATLARWIVTHRVVSFEWSAHIWVPLFQFNRSDMSPLPGLDMVLAELTRAYDRWEIASWFARPNQWLAQRSPADLLATEAHAVQKAARAELKVLS